MDLTPEEFKMKYLGTLVPSIPTETITLPTDDLAAYPDWRTKGAVTPVKNQAQCGSCWSFSTTGAIEGRCFLDGLGLASFSEQQLIDCTTPYGNYGCRGGFINDAFNFLENTCLFYENEYPYTASDNSCKTGRGHVKITGYASVPQGDVNQLAAAVSQQPVAITVDANNWQLYSSGIFTNCQNSLDHAVLLVGYTANAWIVKNSWGPSWGENGYIRLGGGNTCGLANVASYPTGCVSC